MKFMLDINTSRVSAQKATMYIDFINVIDGGTYKVEGYIEGDDIDLKKYFIQTSDQPLHLQRVERVVSQEGVDVNDSMSRTPFEIVLNTRHGNSWKAGFTDEGGLHRIPIQTNRYTGLSRISHTYHKHGNLFFLKYRGILRTYKVSALRHVMLELRYILSILFNWRLIDAYKRLASFRSQKSLRSRIAALIKPLLIVCEAVYTIPRAIILRLAYYLLKPHIKKPIWILSDRTMAAGDNGEALFHYLNSHKAPASVYFVISDKSKDYDRLKKKGRVLKQGSLNYMLMFLLSSKIISSQANTETLNPFTRQINHYVDLFNFDFIFLQHGIIRHDLSSWLNRFNKNISLFITSSEMEYHSIFSNPYHYEKKNVLLSGLPRYDLLENKPEGKLILAPTYRNNLASDRVDKRGVRKYDEHFKQSDYYDFYNKFINEHRIADTLRKYNMTGEFYLHPVFSTQASDFQQNEVFKVMDYPYDYKQAFKRGNLLVSDHSSVVFDFAYLKKPVLYAYFDVGTFFENHTYDKSDFFSDEKDGFGMICDDYESLVCETVKLIESGCEMSEKYKQRVDTYFHKTDRNNCRRVYEAILQK